MGASSPWPGRSLVLLEPEFIGGLSGDYKETLSMRHTCRPMTSGLGAGVPRSFYSLYLKVENNPETPARGLTNGNLEYRDAPRRSQPPLGPL